MLTAEFIGSLHLPALDFTNWCNIIVAKYGDLYWSEELLVSLYEVIHGQKPDIDRLVHQSTATGGRISGYCNHEHKTWSEQIFYESCLISVETTLIYYIRWNKE